MEIADGVVHLDQDGSRHIWLEMKSILILGGVYHKVEAASGTRSSNSLVLEHGPELAADIYQAKRQEFRMVAWKTSCKKTHGSDFLWK